MGAYLNPGKQGFEEAVRSQIYVNKTKMIGLLNALVNTKQKNASVSRPRRFGKTMAANMICARIGTAGAAAFEAQAPHEPHRKHTSAARAAKTTKSTTFTRTPQSSMPCP